MIVIKQVKWQLLCWTGHKYNFELLKKLKFKQILYKGAFASKIDIVGNEATVVRETDGGSETVKLQLPAVMTADLRLNTPRYASLPNIMKAKKKPLAKFKPQDFGVDISPRQEYLKVEEPPKRQGGGKVANVEELVDRIKKLGVIWSKPFYSNNRRLLVFSAS